MKADLNQWGSVADTVKDIALWLEHVTGLEFTLTSVRRLGDPGVHGTDPTRGLDLRCYDPVIGAHLVELVNSRWMYDPQRPEKQCAYYHDVGQGPHIHLQSHSNTVRR